MGLENTELWIVLCTDLQTWRVCIVCVVCKWLGRLSEIDRAAAKHVPYWILQVGTKKFLCSDICSNTRNATNSRESCARLSNDLEKKI